MYNPGLAAALMFITIRAFSQKYLMAGNVKDSVLVNTKKIILVLRCYQQVCIVGGVNG